MTGPREASYQQFIATSALLRLGQGWVPWVLYGGARALLHTELMAGRRRGGQSMALGLCITHPKGDWKKGSMEGITSSPALQTSLKTRASESDTLFAWPA